MHHPRNIKPESDLIFNLYLIFTVSFLIRSTARLPILGTIRFEFLLAILLLGLILIQPEKVKLSENAKKINNVILLLLAYSILSLPFVEYPGSVIKNNLTDFIKAILFFYFTLYTVTNLRRLKIFIFVYIFCQLIRILEPLYMHVTTGYWGTKTHLGGGEFMARLSGSPYDIIGPNELAFIIASVIPFLYFLCLTAKGFQWRLLFILVTPALIYTLILTSSRSGFIAVAFALLLIFLQSKKKVFFILIGLIALPLAYGNLTDNQKDRYLSIFSSDAKGAATSQGRKSGVIREFNLGLEKPIFGHGLGTSLESKFNGYGDAQIAHNLYTEVLIELGFIGLFIFLKLLILITTSVKLAIKESLSTNNYIQNLGQAMKIWLYTNLLFSLATFGLHIPIWYLSAGLAACLLNIIQTDKK